MSRLALSKRSIAILAIIALNSLVLVRSVQNGALERVMVEWMPAVGEAALFFLAVAVLTSALAAVIFFVRERKHK